MTTKQLYIHKFDPKHIVYIKEEKLVDYILCTRGKGTKFAVSKNMFRSFYKPYTGE